MTIQSERKKMGYRNKFLTIILSIIFISFSLYIYKDYGFGTDEHINRSNGGISFNYVLNLINNIFNISISNILLDEFNEDLNLYKDRDYGVAFDLPAMIIERIFNINDIASQFYLRHFLTHLMFLVGNLYFFKLINNRYDNYKFGIIGLLFMLLSPRIFAESFYNNKDIAFMSAFIVALYYSIEFIKKPDFKNGLLSAVTTSFAIDIRIVGIILPPVVISALFVTFLKDKKISYKNFLLNITLYIITIIIIVIALWPWLWSSPFEKFYEAIKNMAKFRWLNWVFYRGHYYPSNNLPWHYLPIWILITTPILYLVMSAIGGAAIIKNLFLNKLKIFKENNELIDLVIIALLFVPIISVIILKSTVYDGWRQFYFLYPLLIYIAVRGFVVSYKYSHRLVSVFLFISTFHILNWMVINHPYQFVYFNMLAGNNWNEKYEMDYWGLTNVDALRKILTIDNKSTIRIYGLGNTSMPQAFSLLNQNESKRFMYVKNYDQSDYVITNYRFLANKDNYEMLRLLINKCPIEYQIKIDDKLISSVFKSCNLLIESS